MSLCLSADEIRELTGKKRQVAQERVLAGMQIPFRKRPDGSLVVIRTDLLTAPIGQPRGPALRFEG